MNLECARTDCGGLCSLAASAWRRCVAASARAGASPCAACASGARVAYRLLIEFRKRVRPYLSIGVGVRLCVSVWVSRYSQTTAPRILSAVACLYGESAV